MWPHVDFHGVKPIPYWTATPVFVCFTKGELYSSFFITWPWITCPLEKRECGLPIVREAPGPLSTPRELSGACAHAPVSSPGPVVVVALSEGLPSMRHDVPDSPVPDLQ